MEATWTISNGIAVCEEEKLGNILQERNRLGETHWKRRRRTSRRMRRRRRKRKRRRRRRGGGRRRRKDRKERKERITKR
jgi:hypothetical protein